MSPTLVLITPRPLSAPGWAPQHTEPPWGIIAIPPRPPSALEWTPRYLEPLWEIVPTSTQTPELPYRDNPGTMGRRPTYEPISLQEKTRRRQLKLCNYCGEPGHYAVTCPQAPATKKGLPPVHITTTPPPGPVQPPVGGITTQEKQRRKDYGLCYFCATRGHIAIDCPRSNKNQRPKTTTLAPRILRRICYLCKEKGHKAPQCPSTRQTMVAPKTS